jgi:hypothetical protein
MLFDHGPNTDRVRQHCGKPVLRFLLHVRIEPALPLDNNCLGEQVGVNIFAASRRKYFCMTIVFARITRWRCKRIDLWRESVRR